MFTAPRDGNYRLRLINGKDAKVFVDGASAQTALRLKAGRHRVEVLIARRANDNPAAPVLQIIPAGD